MEENVNKKVVGKFYADAEHYWAEIPATVDGMLGGYGHVSQIDIQGSRNFLKQIFQSKNSPNKERALDCGAGIGRISKNLLTTIFKTVDLVEQNEAFLNQAKIYLEPKKDNIGDYYSIGLQSFEPSTNKYDVIWTQWVLGHLTDEHLVRFLESCKKGLKSNGLIVIKENITSTDDIVVDNEDSSVTRPFKSFMEIFRKAGLDCCKKQKQLHFPKELFGVYMFALRPTKITESIENLNVSA